MRTVFCLLVALCVTAPASAFAAYGEDNPFVEAMLRMMEIFGLIDRDRLPLGVPYLPAYSGAMTPGIGGLSGMGAYPGMGMVPGMSPMGPWSGIPGGGMPGMNQFPAMGGWPGGGVSGYPGWPGAGGYGNQAITTKVADLDGIWEMNNGSFVIIRGRAARLFLSREHHQDFTIGYDGRTFWWNPRGSNTTTRYRYQMRDGRMILRDDAGKVLLLRRRN